tara:strand:- start:369 stop:1064 length:696 start_codon:yes stop_codon:yes gene_type:complete
MITGTLINVGAIIVGSIIGIFLNKGLPKNINSIIFQALGLFSVFLGISLAFETNNNFLIICMALIMGGILGEAFKLSIRTENMSDLLKMKLNNSNPRFTEGLITATMIFSVGSMAIIGPLNEALKGDATLVLTKSMMDGVTSIALSAAFGRGVIFSAIPVLLIQGGIGIGANSLQSFFSDLLVAEISAVGGILILGIGISILEIKKINVINLLPSMFIVIPLFYLTEYFFN